VSARRPRRAIKSLRGRKFAEPRAPGDGRRRPAATDGPSEESRAVGSDTVRRNGSGRREPA